MKHLLFGLGAMAALGLAAATTQAQALAVTIIDELRATQPDFSSGDNGVRAFSEYAGGIPVDTFAFNVTSTSTVQLDVLSYNVFPTFFDSFIRVYQDDGQPLSAANFVASNDDATVGTDRNGSVSNRDSFLQLSLSPGQYIAAVGAFSLSDAEADAGFSNGVFEAPTGSSFPITSALYRLDIYGDSVLGSIDNLNSGVRSFTIQSAINDALPGQTIRLEASRYSESGIQFDNADVILQGFGPDRTVIFGQLSGDRIFTHDAQDESTVRDLTLRDGRSNTFAGAVASTGNVTYRNVVMRGNQALDVASTIDIVFGTMTLDRCVIRDGLVAPASGTRADISAALDARVVALNSLFIAGDVDDVVVAVNDSRVDLTNCTVVDGGFAARGVQLGPFSSALITNCVFDAAVASFASGNVVVSRSMYPGLTGDNIDAVATFVDAANGDYRLTADSPGIDAGDFSDYLARGGQSFLDVTGNLRVVDVPGVANFSGPAAIDLGAFELDPTGFPSCPGDVTGDDSVDGADLLEVINNFGQSCP